jgi:electron transfer DM13
MNQQDLGSGYVWSAFIIAALFALGQGISAPSIAVAQPGQPVILAMGQWQGIDSFHQTQGRAILVRLPDSRRFIRFEDFRVTNGPDLYVYLSGHPSPRTGTQLHEGAAFEVARLKGNIGSQNYELPADLDLSKFKSVAIYCKRFSVMFGSAQLITPP